MKTLSRLAQGIAIAALLTVGGCTWFRDPVAASGSPPAAGSSAAISNPAGQTYFVVRADFTPIYRSGPQQPTGPDQSLLKGTVVSMLKRSFGYSRVQLENGLNGYVATDDLELAKPDQIAPPAPPPQAGNDTAIVEKYSVEKAASSAATSAGNAEALPDLPEPRLEPEPTPVVKPDFRY